MALQLYPAVPERRRATIARDVAVVVALVLLAWFGFAVYQRVESVSVVARGVTDAGTSVQDGFRSVGDAVDRVPVVGSKLSDALGASGDATGGNVADLGRQGEDAIRSTARLVGFLTFLVPAALLLGLTLPGRIRQVREMARARQVLAHDGSPERERVLAMRAAFSLPMEDLLEYTPDPFGDLAAGRHDRLLDALHAESGIRPTVRPG